MQYLMGKEFHSQIQKLRKRGGTFTKAANEASDLVLRINTGHSSPFESLNLTHHGESRIKKCIKYDLPGSVRLVTVQDNGVCLLAYLADHEDTEKWLETKKGLNLTIDPKNKALVPVQISENITDIDTRIKAISDYSEGLLYTKLKEHYFKKIAKDLPYENLSPFLRFDSLTEDDEIVNAAENIDQKDLQYVFFDVFLHLLAGDVEQAQNRILTYEDELKLVAEVSKEEVREVHSNDQYINIEELEAEFLKGILETKGWYEWMAFLHPDQKKVVQADFKGSARLLGVSGSGKTSVLVHRAVRLAENANQLPVLILTLNESLAKLINTLVDLILHTKHQEYKREKIEVSSFWQLCKNLIIEKKNGENFVHRILSNITHKTEETIDDIWDEFYCQKNNNEDAKVLFHMHQSLLSRNVLPTDYIRQEFDWIRSAFPKQGRNEYLTVEREGRSIPIIEEERKKILEALDSWEDKMEFVGAIDYLGLSNILYEHIYELEPLYSSILVDEVQDFGTIELSIIRKLVAPGENDLFICGDIAQQVYNKQHKLRKASITIPPEGFLKILKNYRNSREILEAASSVFENNVDKEKLKSEDFEILNPEFANFSSPKPFLRKGESFINELDCAIQYLNENLDHLKIEKGCIAICGLSLFNVITLGKQVSLPVLCEGIELNIGNIFLSDLEQTKGFEFDRVVIINCTDSVFPNKALPNEEWYREISKLYVAMTRAKKEMIVSFHEMASKSLSKSIQFFTLDNWADHVPSEKDPDINIGLPKLGSLRSINLSMTGIELLYSNHALGFSRDLQNKLIEIVNGKNISDSKGKKLGFPDLQSLKSEVVSKRDWPHLNRLFGTSVLKELQAFFKRTY